MNPDRARWNDKYRKGGHDRPSIPLIMYQARLTRGRALDVAGGGGENAAILALAGWQVTLTDLSDEALARARKRAGELRADVRFVQADALRLPFRGPFETVVVVNFLERALTPELIGLLAPGGTLYAETFTRGLRDAYCIQPGEFAHLFGALEVVLDTQQDDKSVFIGRRKS
jgi:SAM-dependent methyltransferase